MTEKVGDLRDEMKALAVSTRGKARVYGGLGEAGAIVATALETVAIDIENLTDGWNRQEQPMPLGHDPRFCATCVDRPRGSKFCQEELDEAGRCTGYSH
jgi:hypothetical protein